MRKLFQHFKPYLIWLLILVALVYGQTIATLALPDLMADIVNNGIIPVDSDYIIEVGTWMLIVTLLGGVATASISFVASKIAAGFVRRLRNALFTQVENFSLAEFNTFSTASLITRATNDMQQLQQTLVMIMRMALAAPFLGVGAIIKAHSLSPDMSWVMALSIGIIVLVIAILFTLVVPKFKQIQLLVDRLSLVTREMLTGIRVIRAFHKEKHQEDKFDTVNRESVKLNLFVNRAMITLSPTMMLVMSLTSLATIWIGARYVDTGALQLGDMMAFMQYAIQAISAFLMLSFIFILAPRALVSAQRISEVLSSQPSVSDPENPKVLPKNIKGRVEFNNVSFKYGDSEQPILSNVSFVAEPGQTTAVIGGTGSGKSTVMNLVPRLYDVTHGEILLDGIDVRNITQNDLRSQIGYAAQKAILFTGTIADNINYGGNTSKDRTRHAAKIAQASEFIDKLDDKYDHQVARGGSNLSGGQKQRISIARALAKNPAIYLFDESFSALDFKTESKLRKELNKETKGKTVIIVGQRVSSILHADKIVVLDNGKVSATGTHSELLKSSTTYREIAESQLSEEELEGVAS